MMKTSVISNYNINKKINKKIKIKIKIIKTKNNLGKINKSFYFYYCYQYKTSFSLLEILEKHHINIDYQCRAGYCGICKILLINGKIKYKNEPLAYTKNHEILPCSCIPIENILLKI